MKYSHRGIELSNKMQKQMVYFINCIASHYKLYNEDQFINDLDNFINDFRDNCRKNMPEIEEDPLPGELYQITGGPGEKCLSNGYSWKDSKLKNNKKKGTK